MIEAYDKDGNKIGEFSASEESEALSVAFDNQGWCRERGFGDDDNDIYCPIVLK